MKGPTHRFLRSATAPDFDRLPAADEVLDGLREPVVVTDDGLVVQYVNPAAERLLGGVGVLLHGRPLSELLPELSAMETGEPCGTDRGWRMRRWSGGWIASGPAAAAEGQGDIGQRMVETEQLAAVGQLAAGVAHEIGAPLTAISVAVEYLLRGVPAESETRRDLELVLSQTRRISRLTRQLVDLAKPSEPEFRPTDLNTVVAESVGFLERQLQRDGVEVRTALDPALVPVRGDAHQLQQVLLNLLLNAHRAVLRRPDGQRRIRVRTRALGETTELAVADSGPGIAPDELHRIFLPFVSGAGSTGLGLTVVRGIVHQHGGTVDARNAPGGGAVFVVRLPPLAAGACAA